MTPDIFFVSARAPGADRNWARLASVAPRARRIGFQPSIRAAYAACAAAARTPYCFMVDGDNWLVDGFAFAIDFSPRPDEVAVWRARNPVNGLIYGNGAIKLLPVEMTRGALGTTSVDVGTSLGASYRVVDVLASEHRFNTSAFAAWRTAFRECVKLTANLIQGGDATVTASRLAVWCDTAPEEVPYADHCAAGAREGRAYGWRHKGDLAALGRVNDFEWLRRTWLERAAASDG